MEVSKRRVSSTQSGIRPGSANDLGPFVGEAPAPVPGVGQQLGGRLVAGHDHEEEKGDDLVVDEPVACEVGAEQRRGEVLGRPGPAGADHLVEVAGHAKAASIPSGGMSLSPSTRCMRRSASRRTSARSAAGTPIISEMTSIGSRPAKSATKSKLAASTAASTCSTARSPDAVLELGHPAGGEGLGHERAHPGVVGRVHGQERHGPVGVGPVGGGVERDAEAVRELGRVAEGAEDVVVA